ATIELRQKLLEALAYLEARIDFPDEGDTAGVSLHHVTTRVETARKALAHLASTYASGRVSAEGLRVCLLGAPNAGKSSLMNALLGHDRAIVSEIPGTTRDYLDEKCLVSGRLIRLIDMAGLRETADLVEQLGVARAKELARQADILLLVTPIEDATQDKAAILSWIRSESLPDPIVIVTKIDLKGTHDIPRDCIGVSNLTGEGLDELRKRLAAEVDQRLGSLRNEAAWLTNARHLDCVERAKGRLDAIMERIQPSGGDEDEILAFELREATQALGLLIGEVYADDVLDVVFSSFCIGK
ncbi:MAG: GTP-binding protein, partial [Proteobacteria bacterium]|nr:GTP-binding protein [Pseudomonadota bacterium]